MKHTPKPTLHFRENGTFRILMFSDIQETLNYDPRSLDGIRAMIKDQKPDLVILGGDNVNGKVLKSLEDFTAYLDIFTAPMEETHTPWMHVYGNHDYDVEVPIAQQSAIYESYPHCISGHSPAGVPGMCNYVTPIFSHDGSQTAFVLYTFDTHHKEPVFATGANVDTLLLPNRPPYFRKWDVIRFEQQMWYWNASKALENREGQKVPAMAIMHVAPQEINMVADNPDESGLTGDHDELMQGGVVNSGIFATMLQRGDVKIIAAGHSHEVTLSGVYGGIRFCLDGCAGFSPYGNDETRGGRIFDLHEDGSYDTYMVAVKDLIRI